MQREQQTKYPIKCMFAMATISYRLFSLRFIKYMINRTNISKSISGAVHILNVLRIQCSCSFDLDFLYSSLFNEVKKNIQIFFLLLLSAGSNAIKYIRTTLKKRESSRFKELISNFNLHTKQKEQRPIQVLYIDARNRFPNECCMKYNA